MIPSKFDYHAPGTLAEAIGLLDEHGEGAKVLSGGMSLLPLLKLRLTQVDHLVDIGRIPGLGEIRAVDGTIEIGGACRESTLERSDIVLQRVPILADTTRVIADPLVRNRATVGGNLAHGDPANDQPATMLALRAEVVASGPGGERTIPIDDFFRGLFTTALEPTEILTAIRVPLPGPRSGGAYLKLERKVGDYATAAAAAQLTLGEGGEVVQAGLALTNAGPRPLRVPAAEEFLSGRVPDPDVAGEAGRLAAAAADPPEDWRGTREYKQEMARVLMTRAVLRAAERAGGQ